MVNTLFRAGRLRPAGPDKFVGRRKKGGGYFGEMEVTWEDELSPRNVEGE